ncbi:hypothetical protein BC829DRAFT_481600 [Chytridium lagenaria]|nr:hypothetical protein BC829DRAFT_481600 [Chytridium lagenaria]
MNLLTVSTCSLNQWALDFTGNKARTLESIRRAKQSGAIYRLGPELEISGYGCNDHFLEGDTYLHSWEVLADLLESEDTMGIICDVGMPILHRGVKYNCRVIFYNMRILLIRPKMFMANDGNYRELRWFAPWMKPKRVEDHVLPVDIQRITGQTSVEFGDGVISFNDTSFGTELCEELFTPESPHIQMALNGVEVFTNGSGSHHEFGKLKTRVDLLLGATAKSGGVYLYANQQGCDGERTYYDGCALIAVNGEMVAHGSQFSLSDVEVVTATVDLENRNLQAVVSENFPTVRVAESICSPLFEKGVKTSETSKKIMTYHTPGDEIRLGPACWLWDYLRRSKTGGYFLPLSGGIDSCSTALIVFSMCRLVCESVQAGDEQVIADVRVVTGDPTYLPKDAKDLCSRIFCTCYMGSKNSSTETRSRAKRLAEEINSYHLDINIDDLTSAILSIFAVATGKKPIFKIFGGTDIENLALQNIQARSRMVLAYLFAQLVPWTLDRKKALLVLGSANVDETLRGYFTKYDCSSADVNPIGGISKEDLRRFIDRSKDVFEMPVLAEFLDATPTAELEPLTESYTQADEVDMGMSYSELSIFGSLRKVMKCGPYQMFLNLLDTWNGILSPQEIAAKVKRFFFYYSINRHKTTILPPSYHMSPYSPDDNRFDLRPILYNASWTWQFGRIEKTLSDIEEQGGAH